MNRSWPTTRGKGKREPHHLRLHADYYFDDDSHFGTAVSTARSILRRSFPDIESVTHAADEFASDPAALDACIQDIGRADIIVAGMLFLEDHIRPVLPALAARRDHCDALACCLSAPEIMRMTRLGMSGEAKAVAKLLKKLRGKPKPGETSASGKGQIKLLQELPKILRFIPGTAQDVRAYFLTLQYWLAGSAENLASMVAMLVNRHAAGPREALAGKMSVEPPVQYPELGVYHPRVPGRVTDRADQLPRPGKNGTVGSVLLRSYVLADNARHYDGMIAALEA